MGESWPLAFLLTWTTYGSWFHGDARGSMDRQAKGLPSDGVEPNKARAWYERSLMASKPVLLDSRSRPIVDSAIRALCERRDWHLSALNVRTNHVHAVVAAAVDPARVLSACKAAGTLSLVEAGSLAQDGRLWTRHGSTRWLWTEADVAAASDYVMNQQS